MTMRPLGIALLFALSMPVASFAKDKPRVTIEVVNSETGQRQYTYTTPGREGRSETNCNETKRNYLHYQRQERKHRRRHTSDRSHKSTSLPSCQMAV